MRTKRLRGRGRLTDDLGKLSVLANYTMDCTEFGGMMECTGKIAGPADLTKLEGRRLYLILEDDRRILVRFSDGNGSFQSPGVFDA